MAQHIRHTSRWLLRRLSNLLGILLTVLIHGFSGCKSSTDNDESAPLYGVIMAEYVFKGHVTLQPPHTPVEGIQVTVCEPDANACTSQPTAPNGEFAIAFQYPNFTEIWNVRAEDIDGDAHGNFSPQQKVVTVPETEQWKNHIEVEVDLSLQEISQ